MSLLRTGLGPGRSPPWRAPWRRPKSGSKAVSQQPSLFSLQLSPSVGVIDRRDIFPIAAPPGAPAAEPSQSFVLTLTACLAKKHGSAADGTQQKKAAGFFGPTAFYSIEIRPSGKAKQKEPADSAPVHTALQHIAGSVKKLPNKFIFIKSPSFNINYICYICFVCFYNIIYPTGPCCQCFSNDLRTFPALFLNFCQLHICFGRSVETIVEFMRNSKSCV